MNIKQQADSYVEMFQKLKQEHTEYSELGECIYIENELTYFVATSCAIIHVEGLIKEIEEIYYTCERCVELGFILNELKSRI
jgi:hypothetical protein